MGDWITTANGLIALITGLVGLISAGVGLYFAIKNWIKLTKQKSKEEIWALIMEIADKTMKDVEASTIAGKDKKEMVISAVKEACKTAGIDVGPFVDQLVAYIDSCISWYNGMTDSTKVAKKAKK